MRKNKTIQYLINKNCEIIKLIKKIKKVSILKKYLKSF